MKRNYFARGMALFLAVMLLLTGCAVAKPNGTTAATDATTVPAPDQTTGAANETLNVNEEMTITFFSVNLDKTGGDNRYIVAYPNDDGTVYVEYVGDVKKIGTRMDASVMEEIAAAVVDSGISALNGQNTYLDGSAMGSAYVEYNDGTVIGIGYSGEIPQAYLDAYEKLDAAFQNLTADLDVYVPAPVVMDGVDETALAELLAILEETHIQELDMFQIADVAKDDVFALAMGLSSAEGIAKGTNCSAMMMTTPYSMMIATLEEGADAEAVRDDFVANLDWQKWVCVMPTGALVAQKGNMVLCLMGADSLYQKTVRAITDCGWENLETIDSPFA